MQSVKRAGIRIHLRCFQVSARTATSALIDIAVEISRLGEPANPALGSNLRRASKIFNAGGTLFGYYGSGKSLLSLLYSIYMNLIGERTLVLEAYAILRLEGKVKLSDVSPTLAALDALKEKVDGKSVAELLAQWLSSLDSSVDPSKAWESLSQLEELRNVELELPSGRIEKLLKTVRCLRDEEKVEHIVIDEFERLLASPGSYGYKTREDLLEDVFMLADRKDPVVALSIPHTLRAMLDLETIARLEPMSQIIYEEKELLDFFSRFIAARKPNLTEGLMNKLKSLGVSFKVPRAVVNLATDAMKVGGLEEPVRDRSKFLCFVAYAYPTRSIKRRALLALLYVYTWLKQDAYTPIDEGFDLAKDTVCNLVIDGFRSLKPRGKILDYVESLCSSAKAKEVIVEAYKGKLLEKIGFVYVLSPSAIEHLVTSIAKSPLTEIAFRSYGIRFEPKALLVELQLWVGA